MTPVKVLHRRRRRRRRRKLSFIYID